MKRIAVFLLVLISAANCLNAQPITRRALGVNTVSDARLQAQYNFLLPRYTDTTAANLALGIDSCGAYIYTYEDNATWVRGCSPKRWIKSGSSIVTDNTESVTLSGVGDASDPLVADVNLSTTGNNALQILPDGLYVPNTIRYGIVWGGEVLWISGYSYLIKPAGYYISGAYYESPETTVTLDPADDDSSRIDLFAVNTSSLVEVVEGELSPAPTEPSIDPETQIRLSIALVEAGTTEPTNNGTGLRRECIYKENTEWTAVSSTARINVNSTNSPCVGTKSVEATSAVNGDYVTFTRSSAISLVDSFQMVSFQIKSKANWGNNRRLTLRWYNSGTAVGSTVTLSGSSYGFSSNLLACQTVILPLDLFGLASGTSVDALRITVSNNNGSIGWYIDELCLQNQEQSTYNTPITLQNGLTLDNNTNIGELGGTLLHNTTNSTAYYTHTLSGYPVYNYPYQIQQIQNFANSTGVISFLSSGGISTSNDYNNTTRLGINYTSDVYSVSPAIEGYFGDRMGYMLNTNLRGHGSFGMYQDDYKAKNVGIFFHTKDNSYTDGITIFAGDSSNVAGDYTGLKNEKVAIFKTDKSIQFNGYGDGSFTGTATKWLAVDVDGNLIEEAPPTASITADNGLTMSTASNVQLGGSLLKTTTITGAGFGINFTNNTSVNTANFTNSSSGLAINASSASGNAVFASSSSGYALWGSSTTGIGGVFNINPSSTNTIAEAARMYRTTSGTPANGIGTFVGYYAENSDGSSQEAGKLAFKWTDVTLATRTSMFELYTTNTATSARKLALSGAGKLTLDTYGSGTHTGTATYGLSVDASGNVIETSAGISGITADNGLTANTSSNVRLGGTLLQNTTIDATTSYQLTVTGTIGTRVLNVTNTGSGSAIFGTASSGGLGVAGYSTGGTGVYGQTTDAHGVYGAATTTGNGLFGSAQSGLGVWGNSVTGTPIYGKLDASTTNDILTVADFHRNTSGVAAAGMAGAIDFSITTASGAKQVMNKLVSKLTDATNATRTSQFEIWGVNSATSARKLAISGAGKLTLDTYGSGTHTGTATYSLGVDASGNVIETSAGISGITADNGLTANTSSNVRLGGTLLQNTVLTTSGFTLSITGAGTHTNLYSSTTSGIAVYGIASTSGFGVYGSSSTGYGVYGSTSNANSVGGEFDNTINDAGNTIENALNVTRSSFTTPSAGIGVGIKMSPQAATGGAVEAVQIAAKWTDATYASRTSQFEVYGYNSATKAVKFIVKGSGVVNIPTDPPNYADNAAALAGGLVAGDIYRNGDVLMIVH
jgi:hypothetical protein